MSREKQHQKPISKAENYSKHQQTLKKRFENDYANFALFHFTFEIGALRSLEKLMQIFLFFIFRVTNKHTDNIK